MTACCFGSSRLCGWMHPPRDRWATFAGGDDGQALKNNAKLWGHLIFLVAPFCQASITAYPRRKCLMAHSITMEESAPATNPRVTAYCLLMASSADSWRYIALSLLICFGPRSP